MPNLVDSLRQHRKMAIRSRATRVSVLTLSLLLLTLPAWFGCGGEQSGDQQEAAREQAVASAETGAEGVAGRAPVGGIAPGTKTARYQVHGMYCQGCADAIEEALGKQAGVASGQVSLSDSLAIVTYVPAQIDEEVLIGAIEGLGYGATPLQEEEAPPSGGSE